MQRKPNTIWTLKLACFLALAGLAGCSEETIQSEYKFEPRNGSDRYPITVAEGRKSLSVSSQVGTLQPSQINAISALARQASATGLTPVIVSRPSGGGKSARVASEVANLLVQQGVNPRLIKSRVHHGSANAPVKVSYSRTYAKTKPCGDWSDDATGTSLNEFGSNHGCAIQANIAAMIADPTQIEVPAPTDMPNAAIGVAAVKGTYGSPSEALGAVDSATKPTSDPGSSTGGSGGGGGG